MTAQVPDFQHIGFRQFCCRTVLASAARTVNECIGHILNTRCPSEMRFCNATQMTLAAIVSSVMLGRWRGAVRFLASDASDVGLLNLRVASTSSREGPDEARVFSATLVSQNDIAKEPLRFAQAPRLTSERVTIKAPASTVCAAIAMRVLRLTTVFNQAFSESHFDGPFVGVVRARRSVRALGGFAISRRTARKISCQGERGAT